MENLNFKEYLELKYNLELENYTLENILKNSLSINMRAFFGLSPDPVTKLAIQEWRDKTLPQFNAPVPTANFHVTLAFLGQINPRQLDALCSEIDSLKEISLSLILDIYLAT